MNVIRRPTSVPSLPSFNEEMNTLWSRLFNQPLFSRRYAEDAPWMPPVNVEESDGEVIVTAELPGVDPKAVSVSVDGRELTLSGERKDTLSDKTTCHQMEIGSGTFVRRILLPADVVSAKTAADYKVGLLRITLPKAEGAKRKKIQINVHKD